MQKDDKRGKEETCRNKFFSSPQNIGKSPKKIIRYKSSQTKEERNQPHLKEIGSHFLCQKRDK